MKMKMKIAEQLKLKDNQILVLTNHGDFVINPEDWDQFQEDNKVSYGENGETFDTLLVINAGNEKMLEDTAWEIYSNLSEWK